MLGTAFGVYEATIRVSIGGTSTQASKWLSASTLACKSAPGSGHSKTLILTAGRTLLGESTSVMLSYDVNMISHVRSANLVNHHRTNVSVYGLHRPFVQKQSLAARLVGTAAAESAWISDTSISVRAFPSKSDGTSKLLLTVGPVSYTHLRAHET